MKIEINLRCLKAVSRFMAKKDPKRPYLERVQVEVHSDRTILVACDGLTVGVHCKPAVNKVTEPVMFQIPANIVKEMLASRSASASLYYEDEHFFISPYSPTSFKPWSAIYPDWRRIIPTKLSGEPAQFNVELLKRISDAAKDLCTGRVKPEIQIGFNGEDVALVTSNLSPNFVAALAPLRYKEPMIVQTPNFVTETKQPTAFFGDKA